MKKQGSASNCKEKGCMGKPKKVSKGTTFKGVYCSACMRVVEYEDQFVEDQSLKSEKAFTATEEDIAKAITKKSKPKKSENGEQLSLM